MLAREVRYDPPPRETRMIVIAAWERGGLLPSITVVILCWHICLISKSMGHHDSEIMDDRSID